MLAHAGFTLDSSQAKYKLAYYRDRDRAMDKPARVPASVTSSVLRLPGAIRTTYLAMLVESDRVVRASVGVRRPAARAFAHRLPLQDRRRSAALRRPRAGVVRGARTRGSSACASSCPASRRRRRDDQTSRRARRRVGGGDGAPRRVRAFHRLAPRIRHSRDGAAGLARRRGPGQRADSRVRGLRIGGRSYLATTRRSATGACSRSSRSLRRS